MKPLLFVRRGAWVCWFRGTAIGRGDTPPAAYKSWIYTNLRAMG